MKNNKKEEILSNNGEIRNKKEELIKKKNINKYERRRTKE